MHIKVAVSAIRNTHGLNWPPSVDQHQQKSGELDLLDWIRAMFWFQACSLSRITLLIEDSVSLCHVVESLFSRKTM